MLVTKKQLETALKEFDGLPDGTRLQLHSVITQEVDIGEIEVVDLATQKVVKITKTGKRR